MSEKEKKKKQRFLKVIGQSSTYMTLTKIFVERSHIAYHMNDNFSGYKMI